MTNAGSNWFLTWSEDDEDTGKSFLLQVEIEGVSSPSALCDAVNPYVRVTRSASGVTGPWKSIGETSVIPDEKDAAFPEGFRIFYEHATDLTKDMVRASVYHKHDSGLQSDDLIAEATVTLNELLRTFGTKLKLELLRPKTDKICGRIQFLGEALPARSPRGGKNSFKFRIKIEPPPKEAAVGGIHLLGTPRLFLLVSRERADGSWGVLHRSGLVKKGSTRVSRKMPSRHGSHLMVPKFALTQTELILGGVPTRPIQFQVFLKGRKDEGHRCIGRTVLTVDELLNDLESDSSVDYMLDDEILGEFAVIERSEMPSSAKGATDYTYDIEVNYFDERAEKELQRKRKKRSTLNLNSP
jgi:hypothetical protein